jgi:hypothetical protein
MTLLLSWMSAASAQPVVAVVLVDREAREAGYALEIDGFVVDDALPVGVAPGEVLHLLDPHGDPEPLDVTPGEAWEITGKHGEAWMSMLGEDVRTDRFVVKGDPRDLEELAAELDGTLVTEGDVVYLAGKGVLLAAARVDSALGLRVDEVGFAKGSDAPEPSSIAVSRPSSTLPASSGVPSSSTPVRPVVPPAVTAGSNAAIAAAEPRDDSRRARRQADAEREAHEAALRRYAGVHLCGNAVLSLHPAGVFALNGSQGNWRVSAPGVIRLESFSGDLLYRAAFSEPRFCRAVWGADPIADLSHPRAR